MDLLALLLSLFATFALAGMLVVLGRARPRLVDLAAVEPAGAGPSVSVVIAARDEERNLEEALRSVLALRYDPLEIVAVDDRSSDRTGEILDRLAADHPHLRVLHLQVLPAGWLGKNHALHRGADVATGELLLFTDADVVMAPDAVSRAVTYLLEERLDHLTAAPEVVMPGALLRAFGVMFSIYFSLFARPWEARNPRSRSHVGIGAFNLIRAASYRAIGGHRAIAMRPDDDMKLGKLVKLHGLRQDFVVGSRVLSVEWYASLGEVVRGLTKNAFAGVDYRLSVVIGATLAHLAVFVWPVVALFVTGGIALAASAAAVLLILLLFAGAAREQGVSPALGVLFPLLALIFPYILWRSTLFALLRGGIEWRGTFYSLQELRRNRV